MLHIHQKRVVGVKYHRNAVAEDIAIILRRYTAEVQWEASDSHGKTSAVVSSMKCVLDCTEDSDLFARQFYTRQVININWELVHFTQALARVPKQGVGSVPSPRVGNWKFA